MTLGQRIQAGRNALELSQEALGEKLGVSRQAVSKWEADAAVPDTDKLIALSRLFGVTLNELLQVEKPEKPEQPQASAAKDLAGRRRFRLAAILAAVIFAAMVIDLFAVNYTLQKLSHQVEILEEKISPTALDPDRELVYYLNFSVTRLSDDEMQYVFKLTPAQYPEGLTVTYLIAGGYPETIQEIPATRYGNMYGIYGSLGADGEWDGDKVVTVSARFTDGQGGVCEAELVRLEHDRPGTFTCVELWNKG